MPTLADVLPHEFLGGEYDHTRAFRLREKEVVAKRHATYQRPWPGREKHVSVWFELASGHAVGWNENPSLGW